MFTRTSVLVISTALMLTACSSSSDEASSPAASTSSDSAPALTGTPVSVEVTGEAGSEPVVAITPGDPVTELQVTDVIAGTGDPLPAGATLTADYVDMAEQLVRCLMLPGCVVNQRLFRWIT